ncbi:MAG TPA: helix-turn-helix domain-containing protein [Mycobacteriales bacterium]|nr:helix-turn-helix domain-containing protein [Mycobacteriales bacterium]
MVALPPGRSVAVLATAGLSPFELGVACEVFGTDRSDRGIPTWDFAVCLDAPGPLPTKSGFTIDSPYGLDRLAGADLVIVPSWPRMRTPPGEPVVAALHAAYERGAWILGFCSGTFVLAYAGLLAGRRATTHWYYADLFRELFPDVELDAGVLYVAEDRVLTSAGTSAAIDLSLQVLREVDGPEIANAVARRMVVPPHRDGGQAQFVEHPLPDADEHDLSDLLVWMADHLADDLTVAGLARRTHLSERTFARRFRAETGTTPHHWLTWQRVLLAQRLLETTDLDVDQVARRCGFGGAATLRHHFMARVGTSPQRYRRTFRRAA